MLRAALVVIGLASCAPHRGFAPTIGNIAPTPRRPECSTTVLAEVSTTLRARWGETEDFLRVSCTAGNFPEPGYFISVIGPDAARRRFGVISADRPGVVRFINDPIRDGTAIVQDLAADLDGDGVDEILETWHRDPDDVRGSDESVVIRRLVEGQLVEIAGPHLNVSFPNLGACAARYELERGMLIVTVSNLPGIPPSDCLAPGRHVFTLRGSELVGSLRR